MGTKGTSGVTRRDMVRRGLAGAALGSAAVADAAVSAAAAAPVVPKKWDVTADVVCIGYGAAGAATAIAAHDAGAKVLILEKMPQGGGNTRVSAGDILCPSDAEEASRYITTLYQLSHSEMDADLVRVFCEQSVKTVDWLKGLRDGTQAAIRGGAGFPKLPGAKAMRTYAIQGDGTSGSSDNLWEILVHAVEQKRRIELMTEAPARRLVTNAGGEVIGVIAAHKGREIAMRARRGVVLATGGFAFNDRLKRDHLKGDPIHALGSPGNTGDGVLMAQALGAALWHMNAAACPLGIKVDGFETALPVAFGAPGFIYVDRRGKRFADETSIDGPAALLAVDTYDAGELIYPRIPCYAIFDEETRLKGPVSTAAGRGHAGRRYAWSADNAAEIDQGWIIKAATMGELAAKIHVRPQVLAATLLRWNVDVKTGADTEFDRPVTAPAGDPAPGMEPRRAIWSAPIERPPFYAMELHPALMNTQGGPKRNARAQVMDVFGQPIPRLYGAGELGSMWGMIHQSGGNIAECVVFGQIAGRNAAAEKPWS